jgi:hypothetical protein
MPRNGARRVANSLHFDLHDALGSLVNTCTAMHLRLSLATTLAVGALFTANAQKLRLNAFGGYTFQDRFPIGGTYSGYAYSEGRVAESAHFGGSLEFEVRRNVAVELLYQAQPTEGYISTTFLEYGPLNVTANYIMLGGLHYAPFSPMVHGYGGFNIGAGFLTGDATSTKFAWGGKLGLLLNASEKVGIKIGAQLLSPVQSAGGGFYFGTGGASVGVSTYSSVYQFGFTGGLCFTFDKGAAPSGPKR